MPAFGLALRLWPPRAGYSVPAFRCRRRGHRTQRKAGPFGVPPLSYPRRHGERRDTCEPFRHTLHERILRTLTREVAVWALHESHGPTPGIKLAQHTPSHRMCGIKLALLARNGSFWRVLRVHGELSTVFATNKPSRANFVPNTSWMRGQHTQQHTRPHRHEGLQRKRRVTALTTPGKVARNSIAPTLNRSPETLKFQRREFMI